MDKNTPRMKLTFHWDGTVHKETHGFKGQTCVTQTKFIEDALGIVKDRKFKLEENNPFQQETQHGNKNLLA